MIDYLRFVEMTFLDVLGKNVGQILNGDAPNKAHIGLIFPILTSKAIKFQLRIILSSKLRIQLRGSKLLPVYYTIL